MSFFKLFSNIALKKQIAELKAELDGLHIEFEVWRNKVIKIRNKKPMADTSDEDLENIASAFGGQLPIELAEMERLKKKFNLEN